METSFLWITNQLIFREQQIAIYCKSFLLLWWVSLIRPAPIEFPQVWKEARVNGCSGAM